MSLVRKMHPIVKLIDAYWSFDEYQKPTGSWHDKQALLDRVSEMLSDGDLENRKAKFISDVSLFRNQYQDHLLIEFVNYWSEHNPNGKKMKFEMQKVFDINKRLATWSNNQKSFSKNGIRNTKDAISNIAAWDGK